LGPAFVRPAPPEAAREPLGATSSRSGRSGEVEPDLVDEHGKTLSAADKSSSST
jgi:hypothetical protein